MKVKAYTVVSRAVEEGVHYSITRLFKHRSDPMSEEDMRERVDEIAGRIIGALCEVIEFTDEDLGVKDDQE